MEIRNLKKYLRIIVITAIMVSCAAVSGMAAETLTVGVPADRCPVFYLDPDTGEVTGIGVDLMTMAADDAGYDTVFVTVTEPSLKDALDNDEYDVIMPFGSAITSTSGEQSIVSENLMQTPFTVVTEGNRNLPSLNRSRHRQRIPEKQYVSAGMRNRISLQTSTGGVQVIPMSIKGK